MSKKDFVINEKELSVFIRFNNIFEKFIAETDTSKAEFVSEENKHALIRDYIERISKEKMEIVKNNANVQAGSKINFWALNKNYEEIINGAVKEGDIAFFELLKG